jgi:hypothetical protein
MFVYLLPLNIFHFQLIITLNATLHQPSATHSPIHDPFSNRHASSATETPLSTFFRPRLLATWQEVNSWGIRLLTTMNGKGSLCPQRLR